MSSWRLILNGKSANRRTVRSAVDHYRQCGRRIDVRVTWEKGDMARYIDEAVENEAPVVIAGGGDGTLNEAVSALMVHDASTRPLLALMPLGTANDFAVSAGFPVRKPAAALHLIADGVQRHVDVLRIEADGQQRWCINLASGGFGTEVTLNTDPRLKERLGGLAYLLTGLANLKRIEPIHAQFSGPDFAWTGDFIALGVGNGRQAGGGQVLCPEALIDDGRLELTLVPELSREMRTMIGALLSGGQQAVWERATVSARLQWLEITADRALHLNLDGEPVNARHFRIECQPRSLAMVLPTGSPLLVPV